MTYGQKEIGNIVCDVHTHSYIGHMEPIAQENQGEGDDMMQHQLAEIFPRFLQQQDEHDELLRPVGSFEQVVRFEQSLVRPVREPFIHPRRVEVPDWCPAHNVQSKGTEDGEINRRVELLHETAHFGTVSYSPAYAEGADESLHEEFAGESEDDCVECHEGEIFGSFTILRDIADVRWEGSRTFVEGWIGVGEEYGGSKWVLFAGGYEVSGEDGKDEDEWC